MPGPGQVVAARRYAHHASGLAHRQRDVAVEPLLHRRSLGNPLFAAHAGERDHARNAAGIGGVLRDHHRFLRALSRAVWVPGDSLPAHALPPARRRRVPPRRQLALMARYRGFDYLTLRKWIKQQYGDDGLRAVADRLAPLGFSAAVTDVILP